MKLRWFVARVELPPGEPDRIRPLSWLYCSNRSNAWPHPVIISALSHFYRLPGLYAHMSSSILFLRRGRGGDGWRFQNTSTKITNNMSRPSSTLIYEFSKFATTTTRTSAAAAASYIAILVVACTSPNILKSIYTTKCVCFFSGKC